MRIKLSSLVLVSLISNNAVGDCFTDGYNMGYSEGFADGRNSVLTPSLERECQLYIIGTRKESAAKLENDLTLTLPILLNANGETMANNPTQLKYYQKGLITGTTSQGFHAFTVDSLGGSSLPNPSAKTTLRLLVVRGIFPSTTIPIITSENNVLNASNQNFTCNANSNSCEMELNFGNGKEKVSIPTPQNATWQGACINTDLEKSCNVEMNKPYQTIALIFQGTPK